MKFKLVKEIENKKVYVTYNATKDKYFLTSNKAMARVFVYVTSVAKMQKLFGALTVENVPISKREQTRLDTIQRKTSIMKGKKK